MTGAAKVSLPMAFAAMLAMAAPASAQSPGLEIGLGGVFNAATPAGTVDATLIDPSGESLRLFRTENRIAPGWGAEGLLSAKLTERLRFEVGLGWSSTNLETEISSDFEDAAPVTITQKADVFSADLVLAYRLIQRGRIDVFVRAGGGGFREITSDRALVDNGWRALVGGGTQIRLRDGASGWFGRLALRADVRVQARGGGVAFGDSRRRVSPSVFAGLVIGR